MTHVTETVSPGPQPASTRHAFISGAILMGVAVGLGAFGAHGLKGHTDAYGLATWETAVRYQAWHSLALMILATASHRLTPRIFGTAFICMLIGMFIFSGSLYILVLSGMKWLGAITPIGGLLLIIGWVCTAAGAARHK